MKKKLISIVLALSMLLSCVAVGAVSASAASVDASSAISADQGALDSIQGSAVLHCFNWSYNNIKNNLQAIADAGYTAVQTSPVQQPKDYNSGNNTLDNEWWKLYQPLTLDIATSSWLGTKSDLSALCLAAHNLGIKVIVDIVANHMADVNDSWGNTMNNVYGNVDSTLRSNSSYWHINNVWADTDEDRYRVTYGSIGQPDLNTGSVFVQNKVKNLLVSCVNCGVDGFRFDAAKHIELPTDSNGSNFWPVVINGAKAATSKDLYFYGEILNYSGTEITDYTEYMSVTDNYLGDKALVAARDKNAAKLAEDEYTKGGNTAENTVIWCESHDTYMGNSGTGGAKNTKSISNSDIIKAWAIVGSRSGATSLFFARPNSTMGAASSDTTWKSTAVAEVNKFKNYFDGTGEKLSSENGCAYIERGKLGVAISRLAGGGSVSLTVSNMVDGSYEDQITGNTFTVKDGKITGTVGSTGVAVVYNVGPGKPSAWVTPGSTKFKSDSLDITLSFTNADYGEYAIGGGLFQQFPNGQTITIGADKEYGSEITVRVRAISGSQTSDTATFTYTKVDPNAVQRLYFDNSSYNWSSVYAYIYGDNDAVNAQWPGQKMTRDSATGYYVLEVPEELQNGSVIFCERGDSTTNRYPADGQPGLPLEEKDKIFVAGNKLIDYTGTVNPSVTPTTVPYTTQMLYFDDSTYNWRTIHAYIYAGGVTPNAEWPGQRMTKDSATGYYKLEVPAELRDGYVIFSSNGSETKRYPADQEPGLPLEAKDKIFTAGYKLVDYSGYVAPATTVPTTTKPVATTAAPTTVKPTTKPVVTTAAPTTVKPTTKPVVTTAAPTTAPADRILIGDTDQNGKVTISDATKIQSHIAKLTNLSGKALTAADVNRDGEVNIIDVTCIQYFLVHNVKSGNYCGQYSDSVQPVTQKPTAAPTTAAPTTVPAEKDFYLVGYINGADYGMEADSANLGDYHFVNGQVTASFSQDSYVCVKTSDNKDYYMTKGWLGEVNSAELFHTSVTGEESNKLYVPAGTHTFTIVKSGENSYTLSYTGGTIIVDPTDPDPTIPEGTYTVRLTKPDGWGTPNCYYWTDGGDAPMEWPGVAMTFEKMNDYNQEIYKCEVPSQYEMIIFNDGTNQTVDITAGTSTNYWVNGTDSEGHGTVETWTDGGQGGDQPTPGDTYTLRFTQPNGWGTPNCYYWTEGGDAPVEWPGVAMTFDYTNDYSEAVYKIDVPSACDRVIFNDGTNQTVDITAGSAANYYVSGSEDGKATVTTWDSTGGGEQGGSQQGGDQPTPGDTYTLRFTQPNGWGTPNCYYWTEGGDAPMEWPGVAMTFDYTNDYGEGVYKIDVPTAYNKVIFNDGTNQTVDITAGSDANYYVSGSEDGKATVTAWDSTGGGEQGGSQQGGGDTPSGTYTVRFTKPNGWGTPNIYYWDDNDNNNGWPGTAMEFDYTNDYGQSVYKASIGTNYCNIIFNDGTNQTSDITTSGTDCNYWYDGTVHTW